MADPLRFGSEGPPTGLGSAGLGRLIWLACRAWRYAISSVLVYLRAGNTQGVRTQGWAPGGNDISSVQVWVRTPTTGVRA